MPDLSNCKYNLLSDEEMRALGFTDNVKDIWFYSRYVPFPKTDNYIDFDIAVSVSLAKDGSKAVVRVLDDAFCQPYDYEYMLSRNPDLDAALIVKDYVDNLLATLKSAGILQ